jgi:hypothetical protein
MKGIEAAGIDGESRLECVQQLDALIHTPLVLGEAIGPALEKVPALFSVSPPACPLVLAVNAPLIVQPLVKWTVVSELPGIEREEFSRNSIWQRGSTLMRGW